VVVEEGGGVQLRHRHRPCSYGGSVTHQLHEDTKQTSGGTHPFLAAVVDINNCTAMVIIIVIIIIIIMFTYGGDDRMKHNTSKILEMNFI
jgi:hypothetical protein